MKREQGRSDLYGRPSLFNRNPLMAYLRSSSVANTWLIVRIVVLLVSRNLHVHTCKNSPASKGVSLRLDGSH